MRKGPPNPMRAGLPVSRRGTDEDGENYQAACMDGRGRSRIEEAFEEQDSRQNDLTDDEADAWRCQTESSALGHIDWSPALNGTSP